MKKFVLHIIKILLLTLVMSILLDLVYTSVLSNSKDRFKVDFAINKTQNFDLIILGSSRAENHFETKQFEEKGFRTFNFGMQGSNIFESALMLKVILQNNKTVKNVVLECDLNLENLGRSEGTTARFMPFLHTNNLVKEHYKTQPDFFQLYYIPFYRYLHYSEKIGLREVFNSLIHKKSTSFLNGGFSGITVGNQFNMAKDISHLKPKSNPYYEEIKAICKKNNINLTVVMTPMCSQTKGIAYFEKLRKIYPEIHNFENAITQDELFSSCGHLNQKGAEKFTKIVIDSIFK